MLNVYQFIFTLILAITLGFSCSTKDQALSKTEETQTKAGTDTTHVTATVLSFTYFELETLSQGLIRSKEKVDITLPASGIIQEINIKRGQRVIVGDILARLDDTKWKQEYELLLAEKDEKKLQLEAKVLSLGYHVQNQPPDDLLHKIEIELGLQSLLKRIQHKETELAEKEIKAPISGIVADLEAQAGNPTTNFKKLCTIVNDRKLEIKFPLLESEIDLLKRGMPIGVTPFYSETSSNAIVSSYDPMVDEHGMVWAYADLQENKSVLLDGMKVKVILKQKIPKQRVLPKSAVLDRQDRYVTFVYKAGQANWVYAQIDQENSKAYSLKDEGPQPGDTVIISNNFGLSHLEPVVIDSLLLNVKF